MEPVLMYLIKMLVCSTVLYAYYRLALYNERFHQWNRFYLLAAMVLSVVIPFVSIPVMATNEESDLATAIASLPWNIYGTDPKSESISWNSIVVPCAACISAIFFVRVIISLAKIFIAHHSNPVRRLQYNVQLIVTKLSHAPFSFFNWLFWRNDIDPVSPAGQRMLNHELTHIREHHSVDKLFTSLLLCVFWMNPFFWLMRRELSMIHEFLADRKAIGQDGAAFAEMILQSLPLTPVVNNSLVNPFFSSQIKRRLLMITISKHPKYSYLRRISGLGIMICSVFALALSVQQAQAQQADKKVEIQEKRAMAKKDSLVKKTTDDPSSVPQGKSQDQQGKKSQVKINKVIGTLNAGNTGSAKVSLKHDGDSPLFFLDGQPIDEAEMQEIEPNVIKEVNVFKGASAIAKYGEKGKNGVVEIKMKTKEELRSDKQVPIVIGYGNQGSASKPVAKNTGHDPLYFVGGREITIEEMSNIKPDDIESINVLKDENATKKYAERGKNGVIEIVLKKP